MVVLCTVTELTCNISFGSTASLCSLSMEIREAEFFYGKQILLSMFFFENDCHQVKSSFILNMDLDKSGLVFSCLDLFVCFVLSTWKSLLDKLKLNLSVCHLVLLYTVKLIFSYCSQYCIVH